MIPSAKPWVAAKGQERCDPRVLQWGGGATLINNIAVVAACVHVRVALVCVLLRMCACVVCASFVRARECVRARTHVC